ncbi:hypothetical protein DEA8626_02182 [Defluviimonas aquaemixtae]|uniref:HTH marR-type domain-containing protein n=1 Tax=Albidovulum aquaemixtae TaxID=1542388 RepID=A0A2R8B7W2_9RHOB|nr:MarR family transcriptional regulator [Defluviimonas aquaemixtae]SPH18642.1 hypothetical protein DEA8626_02182 [Defluviimonas aquaemixtae]
MDNSHRTPLYRLIVEIRGAFNELKSLSDEMIVDLGVTAAMRAVLEHLDRHGPATVPQIAKAKSVTRQHIQVLADLLVEKGFAKYEDNPAHQRSRLVVPTPSGDALFAEVSKREARVIARLGQSLTEEELEAAATVLQHLRDGLRKEGTPD